MVVREGRDCFFKNVVNETEYVPVNKIFLTIKATLGKYNGVLKNT